MNIARNFHGKFDHGGIHVKTFLLLLWKLADPVYFTFTRLSRTENSVFRVRLTRYKGAPLVLSDGCEILKNDLLVKIHFHNVRIFKELSYVKNDLKKARLLYREVEQSLPSLASYLKSHKKADQIKGIVGITMINRGYVRLGFESGEITNRLYRLWKLMIQVPIYYLAAPSPSFKHLKKQNPNYLFMSKETLFHDYLKDNKRREKLPPVSV